MLLPRVTATTSSDAAERAHSPVTCRRRLASSALVRRVGADAAQAELARLGARGGQAVAAGESR